MHRIKKVGDGGFYCTYKKILTMTLLIVCNGFSSLIVDGKKISLRSLIFSFQDFFLSLKFFFSTCLFCFSFFALRHLKSWWMRKFFSPFLLKLLGNFFFLALQKSTTLFSCLVFKFSFLCYFLLFFKVFNFLLIF